MTPEEYRSFIAPFCGPYFAAHELVSKSGPTRRRDVPNPGDEANIIPTLDLANLLREELGLPLEVVAACRKTGGEPNSAHVSNRALDLDLQPRMRTKENIARLHNVSAWLWRKRSELTMALGMGHYVTAPWRVHVDTGRGRHAYWYHDANGNGVSPAIATHGSRARR